MSASAYNLLTTILAGIFVLSFLAAIGFLLGALVGWRTPFRKRRFLWGAGLFGVTVGSIAVQQALLWWVFLPSFGRELREQARENHEKAIASSTLTRVGDIAPEFSLVTDNGTRVDSGSLRGKVFVLNFFATWCGPCVKELPHLQALWEEFGQRDDFSMLVVGREETAEAVAEFKSRHGFTFQMAADPERAVYSRFASERIPRTYVISGDGTIVFQTVGFDPEEFDKLRALIARELQARK